MSNIGGKTIKFDNKGNITNLNEVYTHLIKISNATNDTTESGANLEKQRQESIKSLKELVSKYQGLQSEIQDLESSYYDLGESIKEVYNNMSDSYADMESKIGDAITHKIESIFEESSKVLDKLKDKINKTFEEESHEDRVAEYEKELLEIRSSITEAMRSGDQQLIKSLQDEYNSVQKEMNDYLKDYNKDQALNKIEEEQTLLEEQKEEMLSNENLTKLIAQAMSNGFITVGNTVVDLQDLMADFIKETEIGTQNIVLATDEWVRSLQNALEISSQLSGINKTLGLNTTISLSSDMESKIAKAMVGNNTKNNTININTPLVKIDKITSDNYNDTIDDIASKIYATVNNAII